MSASSRAGIPFNSRLVFGACSFACTYENCRGSVFDHTALTYYYDDHRPTACFQGGAEGLKVSKGSALKAWHPRNLVGGRRLGTANGCGRDFGKRRRGITHSPTLPHQGGGRSGYRLRQRLRHVQPGAGHLTPTAAGPCGSGVLSVMIFHEAPFSRKARKSRGW